MKIKMNVSPNQGYGADQVTGMTLADLRASIDEAITEWGEDAEVVTFDLGNRYGAKYGTLSSYDTFEACEDEADYDGRDQ